MEKEEEELKRGHWNQAAMAEEFVTLKDVAMDFTLEDWEDLESELGQRDLFWDATLNNYQDLFSFTHPPQPSLIFQPDVREELEAIVRGGPEATSDEATEAKNPPLQSGFLEEDLSQIMEIFSTEELNFESCIGENWFDSFLGDPESLPRPDISNKESPTDHRCHESKSGLSPGPPHCTREGAVMSDSPEKNLAPVILKESRSDLSQQDSVQGQEKLYKCSECGKSFSQSYHLIQHWVIHARGELPAWQEQPGALSKGALLLMQPGTQTSSESYVCQECGKSFSQNMYLQWHQKIHTGEKLCKTQSDNLEKPSKGPSDEPGKQLVSEAADSAKLCDSRGWDQEKPPTNKRRDREDLHKGQHGDSPSVLHPKPIKHQKTATRAKCFRCRRCGKTFSWAFHLADHQKVHTQRLYGCTSCPAVFNLRKHFFQHRKTHFAKTVFECQECRKLFNRRSSLIKHQAVHTGEKPYKCNECGKAFNHFSTLKIHQRIHSGEKPYTCSECGKTFSRRTALTEHQRVHSGFRPHQCPVCPRRFSRPSHLTRHQLSHAAERLFGCAKCKETFGHKEQLERHYKSHTIECSYECKQCGEHFICSSTLNCHLSIHIRENTSEKVSGQHSQHTEKCFKNTKCEKAFNHSKYPEQHEKIHAKVASCEQSPCRNTCDQSMQPIHCQSSCAAVKPNECTEPEKCMHNTSVSQHQPSQSEPPFKCNTCNRTFKQSAHLSNHQLIHTTEKPFKCKECDRAFKHSNYLIQHQKIHSVKDFECSECGKKFHQKSCLSKHQKIHSGQKPFKCADCGKAFIFSAQLIRHQRIHTGEKPYICQECGKAFSQSSCLTLHLRTHTGEKPYTCSTCGKAFSQKANQRKHERTHSGEKPCACDVCGKSFGFSTHLRQHQRIHTKEKPRCQDCHKAFHSFSALSEHQKLHTCTAASTTAQSHLLTAEARASEGPHLEPAIETSTLQTSPPHSPDKNQ